MTETRRAAIYARVSTTNGQTPENQVRELRAVAERHGWQLATEYVDDGISGAKGRDKRPQFDAMLKAVARREFDVLAAWSVDRLGRSLQDLVGVLGELHAKGVDLYLHQQGVDTTTPAGRALFQMLGVFAEFERAIIVERVNAGIARAREKGTRSGRPIGRPSKATPELAEAVRTARADGESLRAISRRLDVSLGLVRRVLAVDSGPNRETSA